MRRILIVDDQPDIAKLYATALQVVGYDAIATTNGADALTVYELDRAKGKPFDLVILDIGMPFMNGYELAERLKELTPEVPLIFLSAFNELYCSDRESEVEPVAHLTKPVMVKELQRCVAQVMGAEAVCR